MGEPIKSLGEKLCDALNDARPAGTTALDWAGAEPDDRSLIERAALAFVASLSDADPFLTDELSRLRGALSEIADMSTDPWATAHARRALRGG